MRFQPSYLWRSFLNTWSLVEEGLAWHVGSGVEIDCWRDKWIGTNNRRKPDSPFLTENLPNLISDLIHSTSTTWKSDLVFKFFCADEVKEILKIPLSPRKPADRVIWNQIKNWSFTVRSTYFLAVNKFSKLGRNLSSSSSFTPIWKKMWSKKSPLKSATSCGVRALTQSQQQVPFIVEVSPLTLFVKFEVWRGKQLIMPSCGVLWLFILGVSAPLVLIFNLWEPSRFATWWVSCSITSPIMFSPFSQSRHGNCGRRGTLNFSRARIKTRNRYGLVQTVWLMWFKWAWIDPHVVFPGMTNLSSGNALHQAELS